MAPLLKAVRAMSMEPYAVMSTTGRCGSRRRISLSKSSPLRSGKLTSRSRRSKGCSSSLASPDSPVSALETPYPSLLSSSSRPSRISDSSSTTRMEPLGMNRFPHSGKLDMERGALSGRGTNVDFSGMFFDDAIADGEAQASAAAIGLGGEKGIEDAMNVLARDSGSRIGNFDFDGAVVRGGANLDHAAAGHGIAGVEQQIEKHLLKLVGGAAHAWQTFSELFYDLNARSSQRMHHKRKRLFQDTIDVHIGCFGDSRAGEVEQVVDDFAGAEGLFDDFVDDALPGIAFRHLLGKHLDVVRYDREGGIHFVRDARSQQAERGQLFRLGHLLFHALALGDVIEKQETADAFAGLAHQRRYGNVERQQLALMLDALLVNAGNLFALGARGDFLGQFSGQYRPQLAAHGVLPGNAEELLHMGVPSLDDTIQIDGQDTDIEGFDDVFAEVL